MERVSEGFSERLVADRWLLAAWTALVLAAWLAVSLVIWQAPRPVGGHTPSLEWLWRTAAWLVVSGGLWRWLHYRPPGFAIEGQLAWSAGRAEVLLPSGESIRGETRVLWQGPLLVGVRLDTATRGRFTLWLTPARLGRRGWWRLQRFLMLGTP
ncbi:hypothetical protein LV475_10125 [Guyparkeria hydrothermalis]|uniref:Uncharacterized protein n=1 Tax=Guyparkeria halophila TaxID=47960 RepID=A0A6I6CUG9_9GAMM|nr:MULTISPECIES: hypothetical protein [Guyparkeria]MCL7751947.1 hypothetical protein [Guyparkeria hydrothermalis]QGT77669.1 hypothetical protein GM160_01505 [Guyparkeria halophila]